MPTPSTEDLKKAAKLFNRWQFQEAADAITQLADEAEGSERQFLLAIAEIAHGFFRIWHKNGEANAMVDYLTRGMEMLKPFGKGLMGLQTDQMHVELEACLDEAKRWRRGESEIFNRDFIPRLPYVSSKIDD